MENSKLIPIKSSVEGDRTRVDFINLSCWGAAYFVDKQGLWKLDSQNEPKLIYPSNEVLELGQTSENS